jgi:hypothetical protein
MKNLKYGSNIIQHVNRMQRERLQELFKSYKPHGSRNRGKFLKMLLRERGREGPTTDPVPWLLDDEPRLSNDEHKDYVF